MGKERKIAVPEMTGISGRAMLALPPPKNGAWAVQTGGIPLGTEQGFALIAAAVL